ncbi:MAG: hypothetical protein R3A46_15565 [Thermomicrobiales bacterium]
MSASVTSGSPAGSTPGRGRSPSVPRSQRRFIPITNADIPGCDEQTPCTVPVHRERIEAVVALRSEDDENLPDE